MVNSLGNLGGFVAPYIVGILKDATGNSQTGLVFLAACLAVTAAATYLYARKRPEGASVPGAAIPATETH
jgi:ACS family tartrate transporter-like MFS transporter